jgi:hypothetical protein
MATFKVTWQFVGVSGYQWNEVFYKDASSAVDATSTYPAGVAAARLAFLHPLNKLVGIRAAQVGASRVTAFSPVNLNGTAVSLGDALDLGPSAAGDTIVCSLSGATSGSRKIWTRGAPDQWMSRSSLSGADILFPTVASTLATWFSAIEANGYGLHQLSPQTPGPLQNIKILSVDGSRKDGTSDITLQLAPGYPFPARVIIGGASKKDLPALNGRWSLSKTVAGTVITIPYQTPNGIVVTGGNGQCRQEQYQATIVFSAIKCNFLNFGTRTTKNPLTRSRGARRAVRIRTSL